MERFSVKVAGFSAPHFQKAQNYYSFVDLNIATSFIICLNDDVDRDEQLLNFVAAHPGIQNLDVSINIFEGEA